MSELSAHQLRFECRVASRLLLGEHQGAAIRGALFHALRGGPRGPGFCVEPARQECRGCPLLAGCPVSLLLATVDEEGRRGGDVPRPYTLEPPLRRSGLYEPGAAFQFGLTMFGRALHLFPYVIVAARRLAEQGIGRQTRDERGVWRAGRFDIERIVATNPLLGREQVVLQSGDNLVSVPGVPLTHAMVLARASRIAENPPPVISPVPTARLRAPQGDEAASAGVERLTLEFLTPTRLIEGGRPLRRPELRPLLQRLVERLSSLWEEYGEGEGEPELPIDFADLMARAAQVRLVADETGWVTLRGYSTRQGAPKQLDGFVGMATYEGDLGPLLPWLVWGEVAHVGKDAVKGCGWYRIRNKE